MTLTELRERLQHGNMTLSELTEKWTVEEGRYRADEAMVRASLLIQRFLADLQNTELEEPSQLLNLTQASEFCGYSRQHLGRLVRSGQLQNYGRQRAPRVLRPELPKKPGYLPSSAGREHVSATSRGQVVRSVLGRSTE